MRSEDCTDPVTRILDVLAFSHREDHSGTWSGDTGDNGLDDCCYEVKVREQPGRACVEGRPMVHQDRPVVAALRTAEGTWNRAPLASVAGLSSTDRALLAAHAARQAQFEHASVAAFARLSLELMAHGAPPELLVACSQAMADEVRHAQRAFALVSAYTGRPLAPGRFAVPARPVPSLPELAAATAIEGALGETLATLAAIEALSQATDPAVVAALEEIIVDEGRHAAMAWQILRWALATGGEPVREALTVAFAGLPEALASFLTDTPTELPASLAAYGLLPRSRLARSLDEGLERVVRPAIADLLT